MNTGLLLLLAVILVVVWVFVRRRGDAETTRPEPVRKPDAKASQFHAVSITFEQTACAAAKEMAGRRFLSSAAPKLPLPECDALECNCRFKHHDDRRSGKDRRNPFSPSGLSGTTGKYEIEKRQGRDRRRQDDDDLENYFG